MGSQKNGQISGRGTSRRHIVLGILAHVDAGKTTLSESLLYLSGKIRRQGRVDHGDAYLDTDSMEKERGITIFAKQAEMVFSAGLLQDGDGKREAPQRSGASENPSGSPEQEGAALAVTLLDTPGHIDFSPEMERTLSVLDYAVLVISAPDGVTGQVRTLWRLLAHYGIPALIFVNKMDQSGMDGEKILAELQAQLSKRCIRMPAGDPSGFDGTAREEFAVCDDGLLEDYLEHEHRLTSDDISFLIDSRKTFPVFFGSALKYEGVDALAAGLVRYAREPDWPETFCAKVFKISRDPAGSRLAWTRVLGGVLRAKMELEGGRKADQLRQYSGNGYVQLKEAKAGQVVCMTGLADARAGEMLGMPGAGRLPRLAAQKEQLVLPILRSSVMILDGTDTSTALKNLRLLEEEEPLLGIRYDPESRQISADIMGEVETQIIRQICEDRYDMKIGFGPADIVYRETIAAPVEGVGHYEPLRHYAEVHLLLEPAERGSGLSFETDVSTDSLALNWQRLIVSNLVNAKFRGVLTGSEITDMKITVIGGRASEKHTEGGDFRQAAVRALRQGLMSAQSILLEPYYRFEAEIPQENIGRLLADAERMEGRTDPPEGDGKKAIVTGTVPAAEVKDYAAQLRAYTHGTGQFSYALKGYEPARHPEEIILEKGYDPAADVDQSPDSVFCSHGAGVIVPWNEVREHMHVDTGWRPENRLGEDGAGTAPTGAPETFSSGWRREAVTEKKSWQESRREILAGEEELKAIFEKTYRGSSWRTPLHSDRSEEIHPTGVWSRDGSLERSMGLQNGGEHTAGPGKAGQSIKNDMKSPRPGNEKPAGKRQASREDYLLVDGYNIIFAWDELKSIARDSLDLARQTLIHILSNYQGPQRGRLIIVFDAYRVHGGQRHILHHGNVDVIYTKEAETADSYIMELTHSLTPKGNVTVATGDGIVQMIIFGAGARRMSPGELKDRVGSARAEIREKYHTDR